MKAIVYRRYGNPDRLASSEVAKPEPGCDEMLIKVHAVSVNDWDWALLQGTPLVNRLFFGLLKPKIRILGSDVAGRVESIGSSVTEFSPGEAVYGDLSGRWGGLAEYVCAPARALAPVPENMTFEQAAAVPQAGLLALQGLTKGGLRAGQSVLINGAGGGVGTFAIQLARLHGVKITAVDSADKLDLLRSMGADHVIDYRDTDFTRTGRRYDLILDARTNRSPFDYARALNRNGTYVTVGGSMIRLVQILLLGWVISITRKRHIRILALQANKGLGDLGELFRQGKMQPVIDGPYRFDETADAFRRFGAARHKGKLVVTLQAEDAGDREGKSRVP